MKLEVAMLVGPESKAFLAEMVKQLDRMERLLGGKKASTAAKDVEEEETEEDNDDDADFAKPKKAARSGKKAAKSSFEEEEETESLNSDDGGGEEEEEEDVIETSSLKGKKGKAKKYTADDVNDACKAYAAENSRKATLALLKKKWKVESVSDLDPSDYADVIEALAV